MKITFNNSNIHFSSTKKNLPVYVLDGNKTLQKFETRKEAAFTLGINPSSISAVLNGEVSKAGDYTFLKPDEVEKKSDNGTVQIDPSKLQLAYYKINPAIYVIEKDGKYTRYPSQVAVARELNLASSSVSRCLNTSIPKCKGYIIISAVEVEKLDENGNTVVDEAKIKDLIKENDNKDAYYVVNKNGSFSRYSSLEETCDMTGVGAENFTKGFTGFKKVIDDKIFVRAKDLETKKVEGENVLDEEKLINLFIGNRFAFYSIDRKGRVILFQSQSEAYGKLNAAFSSITSCLNGKIKNVDGYTFAKPAQVLCINDKNQIELSKEKIDLLLKERFKK